jgi:Tol biopolymer transport system component/predicted Ser/Thr protein kinase
MALNPGTRLGPYEILSPLGAGGMGVVYKASDTRLNRTVAIKVLAAEFSEHAEMKTRFEREAQTIAALNHPNICTLFDVGRQDGADFLVMEYLAGESLAQRLTKGPLPLDEALKVAIALADAIDKAHGQGVTHRDLKPGNVMLTESGAKLLDFGLAKLRVAPQPTNATAGASPASGDTTPGTILGTMQYMAPEQLEGKEADPRTDIFAFGVLLYEMVSGKRTFDGRSQALLIASIMSADPEPLSKIRPGSPPALDYLIQRCLAKDPEQRLQTAWDLVCQLQWIAEQGTASGSVASTAAAKGKRGILARVALAAAALLIAVMALPTLRYLRGAQAPEETRFIVNLPDMPVAEAVSVSPDGRWIAYSGRDSSSTAVFARPIDSEASTKLVGTEGAGRLFWSADSKWIAFFAGGKLKKVDANGGAPQIICDTPDLLGGTWNADNLILFASSKGLQRVMAAGGDSSPVAAMEGQGKPQEPYFLPDGNHYVFTAVPAQGTGGAIYAGSLDSKDATRLIAAQSNAVYADPGYLFYQREGTLYAQPFNAKKVSLSGEAIRIADKVPYGATGAGAFSASKTGILIFRNNPPTSTRGGGTATTISVVSAPLLWLNRSGAKQQQAAAQAGWAGVDLSPDGKRLAAHRHDPDGGDVWIFESGNETPSKFTFDATQDNSMPIWSPDGTRIAFGSHRNGKYGLYLKQADNTRNEELLMDSDIPAMPMDWSPDGKQLVYWTSDPKTGGDIWTMTIGNSSNDKKPIPILQTSADERHPQVSPDGKWIAYSSNETGRSEIYIKSFPEGPAKIQVSVNGGVFPRWRHDGKELYFMNLISLGAMMASDIRLSGSSIQREVPHMLFQSSYANSTHPVGQYHPYAVTRDGQRFLISQFENPPAMWNSGVVARGRGATLGLLMPAIVSDRHASVSPAVASTTPLMVVSNWTSGLKRN